MCSRSSGDSEAESACGSPRLRARQGGRGTRPAAPRPLAPVLEEGSGRASQPCCQKQSQLWGPDVWEHSGKTERVEGMAEQNRGTSGKISMPTPRPQPSLQRHVDRDVGSRKRLQHEPGCAGSRVPTCGLVLDVITRRRSALGGATDRRVLTRPNPTICWPQSKCANGCSAKFDQKQI